MVRQHGRITILATSRTKRQRPAVARSRRTKEWRLQEVQMAVPSGTQSTWSEFEKVDVTLRVTNLRFSASVPQSRDVRPTEAWPWNRKASLGE